MGAKYWMRVRSQEEALKLIETILRTKPHAHGNGDERTRICWERGYLTAVLAALAVANPHVSHKLGELLDLVKYQERESLRHK